MSRTEQCYIFVRSQDWIARGSALTASARAIRRSARIAAASPSAHALREEYSLGGSETVGVMDASTWTGRDTSAAEGFALKSALLAWEQLLGSAGIDTDAERL